MALTHIKLALSTAGSAHSHSSPTTPRITLPPLHDSHPQTTLTHLFFISLTFMSSVSKPQISPTNDSPTCDPPTGQAAGDPCDGGLLTGCPSAGDPPSCNQSISACTPIHSHYYTTERFGIKNLERERISPMLATNITPYILGPMPPDAFLDQFLPLRTISIPGPPSLQAGMFTTLLPPTNATDGTRAAGATKHNPYQALVCPSWHE